MCVLKLLMKRDYRKIRQNKYRPTVRYSPPMTSYKKYYKYKFTEGFRS